MISGYQHLFAEGRLLEHLEQPVAPVEFPGVGQRRHCRNRCGPGLSVSVRYTWRGGADQRVGEAHREDVERPFIDLEIDRVVTEQVRAPEVRPSTEFISATTSRARAGHPQRQDGTDDEGPVVDHLQRLVGLSWS